MRRRADDEHGRKNKAERSREIDSNRLDRVWVEGEIQVLRKEKTLVKFTKS